MTPLRILPLILSACATVATFPATASPLPTAQLPPDSVLIAQPTAQTTPAPVSDFSDAIPVDDAELAQARGGEQLVITNQTLVAMTTGNVLNGDYTAGAVTLADNALMGFNGLGNLLINTGAQVSLQTGMNVTINLNR